MSHFIEHIPRIVLVVATLCSAPVAASAPAEIPLWSNGAPGSEGKSAKEDVTTSASGELRVAIQTCGCSCELHIYGTGGHGFGLRQANKRPVGQWMVRFEEWLTESGFLRRP
jgi:hypothetical protein